MKTMKILMVAVTLIVAGTIFYSCQKETMQPVKEEGVMVVKNGSTIYTYDFYQQDNYRGKLTYEDPICVGEATELLFTDFAAPQNNIKVDYWDPEANNEEGDWIQVEVGNQTSPYTTYVTAPQVGNFLYRARIGNSGFVEFNVNAIICCEWVWTGETAWGDGSPYVVQGNWATYSEYMVDATVTLYAGQTMEAGTVHFSAVDNGQINITITLNDIDEYGVDWRFRDMDENVKIQDYVEAPSGNPSPGLFDWKGYATGKTFSILVPANSFYGIHVDVEWGICE